jgi:hypothetical protein
MSGRVIGFIVLTAILAIARAAPEEAKTYVAAIGMGIIVLGWLVLAGMVVCIAYAIVWGVMIPHTRPPGRVPLGVEVSRCVDYPSRACAALATAADADAQGRFKCVTCAVTMAKGATSAICGRCRREVIEAKNWPS